MITIYQKPTCTTCRQVYAALKESGVDFDAIDYYVDPVGQTWKQVSPVQRAAALTTSGQQYTASVYDLLGRMTARLSADWERVYRHPIYFLETFVDPERFRGTCYRAANWMLLGRTTGRGKDDHTNRPNRSIKEVLGYPLTPRFRELLQGEAE